MAGVIFDHRTNAWLRWFFATATTLVVIVSILATGAESAGAQTAGDPSIAAAGDIACDPGSEFFNGGRGDATHCRMIATSNLLVSGGYSAVLPLGDLQYENATLQKFRQSYDPSWGRVKSITYPAVGNHEYLTSGASGYLTYFTCTPSFSACTPSPPPGPKSEQGLFYSYNVGNWHVVALDSNCNSVDCSAGSTQEQWLRNDLANNPTKCTLAYWHHPFLSSGTHRSALKAIWQALYDAGAEVVLVGHAHNYQHFSPLNPDAQSDPNGIREFIVGTGGKNLNHFGGPAPPLLIVRQNKTFGVLKLTLHPESYSWEFVPEAGKTFNDLGNASCHDAPASA